LKLQSRNAIDLVPGRSMATMEKMSQEAKVDRQELMAAAIKAHIEAAVAQQARAKAYAEEFEKAEAARKS
jgi:hypothetical protein